ncbi:uncharacterized protein LOC106462478 [Limulus polyphemus]|uniref:Uncharacterized protein LOC106462478 n=1 Tax=Limulus polyphemus TaxID=6850 RepID=A0ABM1BA25_LIMPO|nr:uncharacterized protein LOC106462478 [Limulus polyphemus]
MKLCSNLRSSMNCVMNYSTNCLGSEERLQTGDLILLTRKHINYVCEEEDAIEEYWKGGECYGKDEIKECDDDFEKRLKERGLTKKPSTITCRHYMNYQQCVQTVVEEKCTADDKVFIGTYLVDKADSLSWVCTDDFSSEYISTISPTSGRGSFKGYRCLTKLKNKLDECTKEFKRVEETSLEDREDFEQEESKEPSRKEYCCAYHDFINCVDSAAKVQCDRDGQRFVQHVLDQTRMTSGDYCDTYGGLSLQCSTAAQLPQPSELLFWVLLVLSLSWKHGCAMFIGELAY